MVGVLFIIVGFFIAAVVRINKTLKEYSRAMNLSLLIIHMTFFTIYTGSVIVFIVFDVVIE